MADLAQNRIDDNTANIPTFYGEPAKDTLTLSAFIHRIDRAVNLLTWNEATAFQYFEGAVRGSAQAWLESWVSDNRDIVHTWTRVKTDFRRNFGDFTEDTTFAQDIHNLTLASYGGDFNKYYAKIVKLVDLHNETHLTAPIPLEENHGFNQAQQRAIGVVVHKVLHAVHDRLKKEYFINGLPKAMVEKIADKPDLIKPPQMIEYLRKCEDLDRKKSTGQQPQQPPAHPVPPAAGIHKVAEEDIDANYSYNRGNFRGRGNNNNRGRGNNGQRGQSTRGGNSNNNRGNTSNTSNQDASKIKLCLYCRKPYHDQEKCFTRIKDNQPCLSQKGIPYWPKSDSAAATSSDAKMANEEQQQQAFSVFQLEV
jgi:hypothetical protein